MNDRLLRALRREPVDATPIWIMRQAGRYLPEYRAIREKTTFLGLCKSPDLAAEVTVQPVDRLGVDAAILFSDILIPVEAMGMELRFDAGEGPRMPAPLRDEASIRALKRFDPSVETRFTLDAIRATKRALGGRVPLLGFAGAPFTLAAYMTEGETSRSWVEIKTMMQQRPALAHELFSRIADVVGDYLLAQIEAGCDAVQLFDSWGGELGPDDFAHWEQPYVTRIVERVKGKAPIIYFGTGMSTLLSGMKATGADAIGLDWRISLAEARRQLGPDVAVQGNLDPAAMYGTRETITKKVEAILAQNEGRPGHVFNLGHGITPKVDPELAVHLVSEVHRLSRR